MSKIIAFCADGTWADPGTNTNVIKLYNAIAQTPGAQIKNYDAGVGADGLPLEQAVDGAFGVGLFQKIQDGYHFFAANYEADDELFIFGFSRGAYTARSLAGMIAICGLPTKNPDAHLVETAFSAYRCTDPNQRAALLQSLDAAYGMYDAKIKMVGVWDTVGSLGIPAIFGKVDPVAFGFLDTTLHPDVSNAYHAVAIDEKRVQFQATLWRPPFAEGRAVEQVYFSGCHGDVGGGNDPASQDDGTLLSDITLGWMMGHARDLGLKIDDGVWSKYSSLGAHYALDKINETWKVIFFFWKHREIAPDAHIGNSAAIRVAHVPGYHPPNLKYASTGELAPGYTIVKVVGDPPPQS